MTAVFLLPAQLSPEYPGAQIQIPVIVSQVPWVGSVQLSGQKLDS